MKIAVPYLELRPQADGTHRPIWNPGPRLKKAGWTYRPLKRADGTWMSIDEAVAAAKALNAEVAARKAAGKRRAPRAVDRPAPGYSIEDLFEDFWRAPFMQLAADGRQVAGGKKPKTIRDYRIKAKALRDFDPELWVSPAKDVDRPFAYGIWEKLWQAKGLHMANGIVAVVSAAWSYAERKGKVKSNPWLRMKRPAAPARLRVGTFEEMQALIRAADAIGEHGVGDGIVLGLLTAQRLDDRLNLMDAGALPDGFRVFRQAKTGTVVEAPDTPMLAARLAGSRQRRDRAGIKTAHVVADERRGRAFTPKSYNTAFLAVRAAAAAGVKDEGGVWVVKPCPSLEDFQDRDLRDTAVTWLFRAGCDLSRIRSISGHTEQSILTIVKHYLSVEREQAAEAMSMMTAFLEKHGVVIG